MHRLLYKLRGPGVALNLPMSDEQKAKLDSMGLQELLQSFHLRGVSCTHVAEGYGNYCGGRKPSVVVLEPAFWTFFLLSLMVNI